MSNDRIDSDVDVSSNSEEENALDNIKETLGLSKENPSSKKPSTRLKKVDDDQKYISLAANPNTIDFKDVLNAMTDQTNETSKANITNAIKNYAKHKEKDKVEIKFDNTKEKVLERKKNYDALSKEISQYQSKVKANREADVLDFTKAGVEETNRIVKKTAKEIAQNFNEQNDFEKNIKNLLVKNKCDTDERILQAEQAQLSNLTPEEIKRRYNEMKRVKALLLQTEIANQRKKKIKSKLYHKINKKRKEKEENELLQQLESIDPEAVKNYREKKMEDRIDERMRLKHSINSKFNKTVKRYHLDKEQQVKEAIKENYQLRDKLLEKIKGEKDDEEIPLEEEENEDDSKDQEEEHEQKPEDGKVVMDFEEKEEDIKNDKDDEEIQDSGVFSMNFMKNAGKGNTLTSKLASMKEDLDSEEDFKESDSDEEMSSEEKQKKSNKQSQANAKKQQPQSKQKNITSDDLNKISKDAKKILESAETDENPKINLSPDELRKIIEEENLEQDAEQFNNFLVENETNKREFLESEHQERIAKIKKENPEFMAGWGSWAGDSTKIKAKEYLQKKRYEARIKKLAEKTSEDVKGNPYVKVNNSFDKNFSNYLVKELPSNVANREEFEMLNSAPIGREWNSLTMYKKMIQPKVIKKIGQIIEPMRINDKTSAKKLYEIIEKATKKKVQTKKNL